MLQAELRNAKLLEQRYRAEAERLRNMSSQQANNAYAEFLKTSGRGLERIPGGEKSISYDPFGNTLAWEAATSGRYSDAQLCARSRNSENDLEDGAAHAACRGIGDTLRAHEDFHVETCMRMGYRAHLFMHKSGLATDEAEAYGRQAASLTTSSSAFSKKQSRVFSSTCTYTTVRRTASTRQLSMARCGSPGSRLSTRGSLNCAVQARRPRR